MSHSRIIAAALAVVMTPIMCRAQEEIAAQEGEFENPAHLNIAADTRVDFDYRDYEDDSHTTGFYGRYLNLIIHADINKHFSMHLRQRLNKFGEMRNDVFGATDWVYLNYLPNDRWTFSAGKQVVAIGGFEYDRNPINVYYASMFWNNIACFQFGVSATYNFADGHNSLMAQISNSPYQSLGQSCFSYNLMWMGTNGCFSSLWSVNLVEYQKNKYGNLIALGNRFTFGNYYAELDIMNRYLGKGHFLFDDYSLILKACATFGRFDVFAKGGYEKFRPEPGKKYTVEEPYYGIGAEYYPLKNSRNLRIHVVADVTHDGHTGERCTHLSAGVMWRVTLLDKSIRTSHK